LRSNKGAGATGAATPIAQTVGGGGSRLLAFFTKQLSSKVVRYSHEMKLSTVFKQFSSNLNLKFLVTKISSLMLK
jgi:hypothetical protein